MSSADGEFSKDHKEQAASLLYYIENENPSPSDLMELVGLYTESKVDHKTYWALQDVRDAAEELDDALTLLAQHLCEVME